MAVMRKINNNGRPSGAGLPLAVRSAGVSLAPVVPGLVLLRLRLSRPLGRPQTLESRQTLACALAL